MTSEGDQAVGVTLHIPDEGYKDSGDSGGAGANNDLLHSVEDYLNSNLSDQPPAERSNSFELVVLCDPDVPRVTEGGDVAQPAMTVVSSESYHNEFVLIGTEQGENEQVPGTLAEDDLDLIEMGGMHVKVFEGRKLKFLDLKLELVRVETDQCLRIPLEPATEEALLHQYAPASRSGRKVKTPKRFFENDFIKLTDSTLQNDVSAAKSVDDEDSDFTPPSDNELKRERQTADLKARMLHDRKLRLQKIAQKRDKDCVYVKKVVQERIQPKPVLQTYSAARQKVAESPRPPLPTFLIDLKPVFYKAPLWPCRECEGLFKSMQLLAIHYRTAHKIAGTPVVKKGGGDSLRAIGLEDSDDEEEERRPKRGRPSNPQSTKAVVQSPPKQLPPQIKCPDCTFVCNTKAGLGIHQRTKHQVDLTGVKCDVCPLVFVSAAIKEDHMKRTHPKNTCTHCQMDFEFKRDLMKHVRSKHPTKEGSDLQDDAAMDMDIFEDDIARENDPEYQPGANGAADEDELDLLGKRTNKVNSSRVRFSLPLATSTPANKKLDKTPKISKVKCGHCDRIFTNKELVDRHIKEVHFDLIRFQCLECLAKFNTLLKLRAHLKKHCDDDSVMLYECIDCNLSFQYRSFFIHHLAKDHNVVHTDALNNLMRGESTETNEIQISEVGPELNIATGSIRGTSPQKPQKNKDGKVECGGCSSLFDASVYMIHLEAVHPLLVERTCELCFKTFNNKVNMKKHRSRVHLVTAKAPNICKICGYAAESTSDLIKHNNIVHTGVQQPGLSLVVTKDPGTVESAVTPALQPTALRAASSPGSADRFECNICHNKFSHQGIHDSHMRLHKNKDNECVICKSPFSAYLAMRAHMKNLHGVHIPHIKSRYTPGVYLNRPSIGDTPNTPVRALNMSLVDAEVDNAVANIPTQIEISSEPDDGFDDNFAIPTEEEAPVDPDATTFCDQCGAVLTFKELPNHLKQHAIPSPPGGKQEICDTCGKVFRFAQALEYHIQTTHNIRYPCEDCINDKMVFSTRQQLDLHRAVVHPVRVEKKVVDPELRCKSCDTAFPTDNELQNHIRQKHTAPRVTNRGRHPLTAPPRVPLAVKKPEYKPPVAASVSCMRCSMTFATSQLLSRHLAEDHENLFPCDHCSLTFTRLDHKAMHMEKKHNAVGSCPVQDEGIDSTLREQPMQLDEAVNSISEQEDSVYDQNGEEEASTITTETLDQEQINQLLSMLPEGSLNSGNFYIIQGQDGNTMLISADDHQSLAALGVQVAE